MEDPEEYSSRPKPSKIPSWVMLGFILGALCVWALPRAKDSAPPIATEIKAPPVARPPLQSDIEAMFARWGRYAMWADDTTYVCMFDLETKTFPHCFEVLRRGENLYFRTIDRPRNLRPLEGVPQDSPLEFLNPVPEPRSLRWERVTLPPQSQPVEHPVVVPTQPSPEKMPVEINPPKP